MEQVGMFLFSISIFFPVFSFLIGLFLLFFFAYKKIFRKKFKKKSSYYKYCVYKLHITILLLFLSSWFLGNGSYSQLKRT